MEKKPKKFVSADDLEWRELNRRVGSCSRKGDWLGVRLAYEDMIKIYKRESQDYSHITESIEKINQKAKEEAKFKNISCLVMLFIFWFIGYFLIWKPIAYMAKSSSTPNKSDTSHRH
ncbi:MAG: hypothetical protein WC522_07345 [Candidatus Omnitrophota bacterium]